jgi:hypothetical protein
VYKQTRVYQYMREADKGISDSMLKKPESIPGILLGDVFIFSNTPRGGLPFDGPTASCTGCESQRKNC